MSVMAVSRRAFLIARSSMDHGAWSVEAARSTTPLILFDENSSVIYRCLRHAYILSE